MSTRTSGSATARHTYLMRAVLEPHCQRSLLLCSPAFSLMVRLADVCWMKMWHSPTLSCRRSLAISCSICFVTRWHPLLAAASLISRCTQVILWKMQKQRKTS